MPLACNLTLRSGIQIDGKHEEDERGRRMVEVARISNRGVCSQCNRPFPSSLVPLFQSESKCETFHMKMSSARSFFFMQIKVIFIRMV